MITVTINEFSFQGMFPLARFRPRNWVEIENSYLLLSKCHSPNHRHLDRLWLCIGRYHMKRNLNTRNRLHGRMNVQSSIGCTMHACLWCFKHESYSSCSSPNLILSGTPIPPNLHPQTEKTCCDTSCRHPFGNITPLY